VLAAGAPLIGAYGAKGAAIALVAAELTLSLCYEWSLSHTRPELRFHPGYVLRAAAATVTAGAIALVLGVSPLASAVLGSAIYIVALLVLGLIPDEIREALFRRHRPAV
jgi:O-antigen/teichoic acid export membrane protein